MINSGENMNVLQLANGFNGNMLYRSFFEELEKRNVRNIVYVPVRNAQNECSLIKRNLYNQSILIEATCFSNLDRLIFYSKQRKILKNIEKNVDLKSIDVIHAHTLFSAGYTAMKLKEKHSVPYVVAVRNTDVNIFFRKMIHLRHIGEKILLNASKVIFISNAYKEHVITEYISNGAKKQIESKCAVIPNGISKIFLDISKQERQIDKKNIQLIYAGEINKNKNLNCILEAVKILKTKQINATLTVVGDVTDPKCRYVLNDPMVLYHKKCTQSELINFYKAAEIFVMPSFYETFGLVYAEAMSCGLPIIYTKGQGFDGQYKDGEVGYAVDPNNSHEIADSIDEILNSYDEISERCYKNARRYSWKEITLKYDRIYRAVLACRNEHD